MRKIIAVVMALTVVLSLSACGGATATPSATEKPAAADKAATPDAAAKSDKPVIAFVPKITNQKWFQYMETGVKSWSEKNGIDVIWKGPTEIDSAAQVQIITDLVAQDIDILCVTPLDPDSCGAILQKARDKGIIVISHEAATMKNVDYDIEAFSEVGYGAFLMDCLAEMMDKQGEYITMVGSVTMESHMNWADAAVAQQKKAYPDMKLIEADSPVESQADAEVAYEVTKEMLKKHPTLKGILGTTTFDCLGAARAIKELGLEGKVFVISCGMPSETRDFLKSGQLEIVGLWDPSIAAQAMLNAGMMLYNGEKIATGADLGVAGYESVNVEGSLIVGQGWIQITKDNVDEFDF